MPLRAIKTLVIFMAILIFAGLALVAFELVGRLGAVNEAPAQVDFQLPPGAAVVQMVATDRHVVLHVRSAQGADLIYVLDPARGTVLFSPRAGDGVEEAAPAP